MLRLVPAARARALGIESWTMHPTRGTDPLPQGTMARNEDARPVSARARARFLLPAALIAILLVALFLRLYGIDWDQRGLFHPDERAILTRVFDLRFPGAHELRDLLSAERSPLNPRWFNYGSLPLYLLKTVQVAASPFAEWDLWDLRIPGRVLSALADTATVALIFLIGVRWYGRRVGLLAAALAALAVIHIQQAHFFVPDPLMTMFAVAAVYFLMRVAHRGRLRDSTFAGLAIGLGVATKVTVAPLLIPAVAAHLIYALSEPGDAFHRGADPESESKRRSRALKGLALTIAVAALAAFFAQPYMVGDPGTFASNVGEQSQMVRRTLDYPYTRQYIDTARYWYQMFQVGAWGLGPVAGILAWTGFAAVTVVAAVRRRKADLVILAWAIPFFLITGWFEVKFMRYLLPLTPFLLLFGARLVWWLGVAVRRIVPRWRHAGGVLAVVVLALTAHYAGAYVSIYSRPHPAQQASEYLNEQQVPPGTSLLKEHWEEGIPGLHKYKVDELGLYDPDTPAKFQRIADQLAAAEYLVLYSNRLYGTIPRLPDRYPTGTAYYRALFDGSLGYELAHTGQSVPALFGIAYDDDPFARIDIPPPDGFTPTTAALATLSFGWADESFSVYDHPKVLVFKNAANLDAGEIRDGIGDVPRATVNGTGLLLTDEEAARQQAGGTWTDVAFWDDLPDGVTPFLWLLAAQVFALAALPLGIVVFRPLPDRGYLLTKALGLLLVATVTWLLVACGAATFSRWTILIALAAVAMLSAFVWWRRRAELAVFFRARWRLIVSMEVLFLVAYFAFLLVRAANPDMWHAWRGGEKPMDFAYLNAVARSTVMPPYDPWFAGGYLNYYYFGQFIVATLIRITGIAPAVAYNLAVPLLFALVAGGAFSIVYSLAEGTRRRIGSSARLFLWSPFAAGLLALVLVAIAGNMDGLSQLVGGAWRVLTGNGPFGTFDFWRSSRMMADQTHGITEFPFFTFLFADLHAHLIAIPFALLAIGLSITALLRASQPVRCWLETWGALALLGVVVGALRIINSWDYPTELAVAGAAVIGGELLRSRSDAFSRLAIGVVKAGFVVGVGYLVFLPFHGRFELFNAGAELSKVQTPLWRYLAVHSAFIFILLGYLAYEWRRTLRRLVRGERLRIDAFLRPLGLAGDRPIEVPLGSAYLGVIVLAALLVAMAAFGYATVSLTALLGLLIVLVALTWVSDRRRDAPFALAAAALAVVALALAAGVDLFTVKGDIGRMNTVFKFYLQAWVLLGLATAYMLWRLGFDGAFSRLRLSLPRAAWVAALLVLLAGAMIYPLLGTRDRLSDRFETTGLGLDGAAFMTGTTYRMEQGQGAIQGPIDLSYDLEGINWLQHNVEGSPVIVEGLTDLYRWGNRMSIYTGLPAVVGWDWHQRQQRVDYAWAVEQRRADVQVIYSVPGKAMALDLLRKYGVRYVIVGELERLLYPEIGLAKFDMMVDEGLTPAYANDGLTIYELAPEDAALYPAD